MALKPLGKPAAGREKSTQEERELTSEQRGEGKRVGRLKDLQPTAWTAYPGMHMRKGAGIQDAATTEALGSSPTLSLLKSLIHPRPYCTQILASILDTKQCEFTKLAVKFGIPTGYTWLFLASARFPLLHSLRHTKCVMYIA